MIDVRLRSRISDEEMESKVGKIVTDDDYNLLVTGAAKLRKPDGSLLGIYLPGALKAEMQEHYPTLTSIRMATDNRGYASGSSRAKSNTGSRTRAKPVISSIMGSFDPVGGKRYCRLTAYTANHMDQWTELRGLFQRISGLFAEHVPDRYKAQAEYVAQTPPEWIIPGTVFSTITINNTYPTGIHTDKGDLDEGFSTLAVCRRGEYEGGRLVWPLFRVAVDLHDGDLLLMDAHEWHGNTRITCACEKVPDGPCATCGAERISLVSYYRSKMAECGTLSEEDAKRLAYAESKLALTGD